MEFGTTSPPEALSMWTPYFIRIIKLAMYVQYIKTYNTSQVKSNLIIKLI